jgi:D-sedoheptulose 7-phosphate isomerase
MRDASIGLRPSPNAGERSYAVLSATWRLSGCSGTRRFALVSSEDDWAESRTVVQFASGEVTKLQDGLSELSRPSRLVPMIETAAALVACIRRGGKVLFCGNGGSAAQAQHLAAELVGRQNYDRAPAAGIALSTDTSVLTALGNDYGYDTIFARQVQALGRRGDVLVGISTSGRSKNVVQALSVAHLAAMKTIAFTGRDPRDMRTADFVLNVPADETAQIQELHLVVGHIVFALVERALFPLP